MKFVLPCHDHNYLEKYSLEEMILKEFWDIIHYEGLDENKLEELLKKAIKQAKEEERKKILDKLDNSDELYDLLPGNGQDDYILQTIRRLIN